MSELQRKSYIRDWIYAGDHKRGVIVETWTYSRRDGGSSPDKLEEYEEKGFYYAWDSWTVLETSLPRVDETSHHVVQKAQHTSGWVPYFLVREIDKVRCEKQPQEIIPLRKYTIQPNSNVESSSQGRSEVTHFRSLPSPPSRDLLQYRVLCPHKREIDSLSKMIPFCSLISRNINITARSQCAKVS